MYDVCQWHAGQRNRTYSAAVEAHLGKWHQRACAAIQYFTLFLCGIGYVITSSVAVVAAKRTGEFTLLVMPQLLLTRGLAKTHL